MAHAHLHLHTAHTHTHPTQRASFKVDGCERTEENFTWRESGQLPVHPYSTAQIPVHPYSAAQIPVHPYSAAQIWLPASTSACACEEEGTQLNSAAGGGTPCDVLFLLG